MTESFIMAAFHRMGQRPLAVKVMRNKFTGEPAGYAFVHFQVCSRYYVHYFILHLYYSNLHNIIIS